MIQHNKADRSIWVNIFFGVLFLWLVMLNFGFYTLQFSLVEWIVIGGSWQLLGTLLFVFHHRDNMKWKYKLLLKKYCYSILIAVFTMCFVLLAFYKYEVNNDQLLGVLISTPIAVIYFISYNYSIKVLGH